MNLPKIEENVLKLWRRERVFARTLSERKRAPHFVFYEGPPTANGLPGIHHVLARVYKDLVCRYKTMRGFFVERKAGWDTHGLPVELEVERMLGLKTKRDIERYGIARFNARCKQSVWRYKADWEKLTERIGFWLDMEHPYITYDPKYMERVWGILKRAWEKKLLFQDYKVVPHCPRCVTTLSSHEVAQGYESITENSTFVKFKIKDAKDTYILSWTTTPWTLPGNAALASGEDIDYTQATVEDVDESSCALRKGETYIFAATPDADQRILGIKVLHLKGNESVANIVVKGKVAGRIVGIKNLKGKDLVGLAYTPLFEIPGAKNEKSHRVYAAGFVNTKEGTGVVHIAPMYGEDDYQLGIREGLPKVHTVDEGGRFLSFVPAGIAGRTAKDKETEKAILSYLAERNLLFREQSYVHDYPFCWRCSSPLLYYAKQGWFIGMSRLRNKLMKENKKIRWVPAYLKEGRFGEWLREVKDWAVSRERFWGIPLPIWRCKDCRTKELIGSVADLTGKKTSTNRYILLRHGESTHMDFVRAGPETGKRRAVLTVLGRRRVRRAAAILKKKRIDAIYASPYNRCRNTAEIIGNELNLIPLYDERLGEFNLGVFNWHPVEEYLTFVGSSKNRFLKRPIGGENWFDVRTRMLSFVEQLERRHQGKTFLIVSHGDSLWLLKCALAGLTDEEIARIHEARKPAQPPKIVRVAYPDFSKPELVRFTRLPRDHKGSIDLHRPFVDAVTFPCASCGGRMRRIEEVIDVWFDSGSMPFAQHAQHVGKPETRNPKPETYPADFICEAIDQTRGWFYTLLAIGVLVGKGTPYRTVISLGHVLDKKGNKMSKSRGNVVDPWEMVRRYGADAVRWYFFTINQPGEPKRFDEKDVSTAANRFLGTLWNTYLFWKTYRPKQESRKARKASIGHFSRSSRLLARLAVLDQWILSRLSGVVADMQQRMDAYDIVGAARSLDGFVQDLSNWYVRRSRRRFQRPQSRKELVAASSVLEEILKTSSLLVAPFAPFLAEGIWRGLGEKKSVHLYTYPQTAKTRSDGELEEAMGALQELAALTLKLRAQAGFRVRQPLATLALLEDEAHPSLTDEFLKILCDEVNVKEVRYVRFLPTARGWVEPKEGSWRIALDTRITETLRRDGTLRELTRYIQEMRKDAGCKPKQRVDIYLSVPENLTLFLEEHSDFLAAEVGARSIHLGKTQGKVAVEKQCRLNGVEIQAQLRV